MKEDDEDEDVEEDSGADADGGQQEESRNGDDLEEEMLKCRDCDNEFPFTVGEQEFFKQKGFENKPTRCADCKVM